MSREGDFIVFCMENYKAYRALTGKEVSRLFSRYDVFGYLREFYDTLHTTGEQYLNQDIDQYLIARNAIAPR